MIFDEIREKRIEHVILVARWEAYQKRSIALRYLNKPALTGLEAYRQAFAHTAQKLSSIGINTWIMLQVPDQKNDPPTLLANAVRYRGNLDVKGISKANSVEQFIFVNSVIDEISKLPKLTVLDPSPYFFQNTKYSILSMDGECLYRDDDHVSHAGAQLLKPLFEPIFDLVVDR